jgi:hypothetical protein
MGRWAHSQLAVCLGFQKKNNKKTVNLNIQRFQRRRNKKILWYTFNDFTLDSFHVAFKDEKRKT